jgi:adenylosuccinate synthase
LVLTFSWKKDISKCKTWEELPQEAKDYIIKIEELSKTKIYWIGVGPERESLIEKKD